MTTEPTTPLLGDDLAPVFGRLDQSVVVLTVTEDGRCDLIRHARISVRDVVDLLRGMAAHMEEEEAAGEQPTE